MNTRIQSVVLGKDSEVLNQLFSFYVFPNGLIVDLTCNTRKMWKNFNLSKNTIFCDINNSVNPDIVCNSQLTPFKNSSLSVIVFDPPHLPSAAGTDSSLKNFVDSYGLKNTVNGDNVSSIFTPFLVEAERILKQEGLIFAKISDFVHNHKYQWSLVDFINSVKNTPNLTACDLIIKKDPCAGNLKSSKWKKTHHTRRSHCYWIVVRKGECESKLC